MMNDTITSTESKASYTDLDYEDFALQMMSRFNNYATKITEAMDTFNNMCTGILDTNAVVSLYVKDFATKVSEFRKKEEAFAAEMLVKRDDISKQYEANRIFYNQTQETRVEMNATLSDFENTKRRLYDEIETLQGYNQAISQISDKITGASARIGNFIGNTSVDTSNISTADRVQHLDDGPKILQKSEIVSNKRTFTSAGLYTDGEGTGFLDMTPNSPAQLHDDVDLVLNFVKDYKKKACVADNGDCLNKFYADHARNECCEFMCNTPNINDARESKCDNRECDENVVVSKSLDISADVIAMLNNEINNREELSNMLDEHLNVIESQSGGIDEDDCRRVECENDDENNGGATHIDDAYQNEGEDDGKLGNEIDGGEDDLENHIDLVERSLEAQEYDNGLAQHHDEDQEVIYEENDASPLTLLKQDGNSDDEQELSPVSASSEIHGDENSIITADDVSLDCNMADIVSVPFLEIDTQIHIQEVVL